MFWMLPKVFKLSQKIIVFTRHFRNTWGSGAVCFNRLICKVIGVNQIAKQFTSRKSVRQQCMVNRHSNQRIFTDGKRTILLRRVRFKRFNNPTTSWFSRVSFIQMTDRYKSLVHNITRREFLIVNKSISNDVLTACDTEYLFYVHNDNRKTRA